MLKFKSLPILAGIAALGLTVSAQANLITKDPAPGGTAGSPTSFAVHFSNVVQGTTLSADFTFSNFVFGNTTLDYDLAISNTSSGGSLTNIRLATFGFDTQPNPTGVTTTSAIYDFADVNTVVPGFGHVDVCSGTNNCSAGPAGLQPGASDSFSMQLTGLTAGLTQFEFGANTLGAPVENNYFVKWQTDQGSFEFQAPSPIIGHGLFVLLAVGGVLFGGKLLENLKKHRLHAA